MPSSTRAVASRRLRLSVTQSSCPKWIVVRRHACNHLPVTAPRAVTQVTDALRLLPCLASLDARALGRLVRACAWRSIGQDGQLFREGGSPDGLFIIVEGRVKLVRLSRTGREQVLHIEGPGASLGDVPVVDGGEYLATAVAITRVRVLFVPRRDLLRVCAEHPAVAMGLATTIARRLRSFSTLIGTLSLQAVNARIAGALMDQHLSTGEQILDVGTRDELAARLGTVREIVSRSITQLVRAGAIARVGRRVRIVNVRTLRKMAEE